MIRGKPEDFWLPRKALLHQAITANFIGATNITTFLPERERRLSHPLW